VIHLAAQAIVGIANRNPISTFESNIRGTWTLLEACRRSPGVRSIVIASSDKAYGAQETLPYTESMPVAGRYPYDVSKSCADMIAQCYAYTYDLPVAVTRGGNEATSEIPRQCLSAGLARKLLGLSPLFTLDEGLDPGAGPAREPISRQQHERRRDGTYFGTIDNRAGPEQPTNPAPRGSFEPRPHTAAIPAA
jgi:nucleoside-diphosphate-sugar epimerase